MMISILLPAYKSEDLLREVFIPGFLHSCFGLPREGPIKGETLSNKRCELIIYDNGGNGKGLGDVIAHEWLPMLMGTNVVRLIGDGKNIGLNQALNECAKVAKGDYFYLPHSDMYLLPGWDTALLQAVKNHPPGSQLLCSRSVEPTKGHTEFHLIKNYGMEHDEFNEKELLRDHADYKDNTIVTGKRMPFFLHRTLWTKMEGVDPEYFSYCTDDDLIQTAYDSGGVRRFWMVYSSLVYHLQGKSNSQQTVDKDSNKPYEYFIEKWKNKGYQDADHPARWHPKLIPDYIKIR